MGVHPRHWRCVECGQLVSAERRAPFGDEWRGVEYFHLAWGLGGTDRRGVERRVIACGPVEPALAKEHLLAHVRDEHPGQVENDYELAAALAPDLALIEQPSYIGLLNRHWWWHENLYLIDHGHDEDINADFRPAA